MKLTDPHDFARVCRLIKAPQQKVYNAWLKPELRQQWWAAKMNIRCDLCEIDEQQGGQYRINMKNDDAEYICFGEFRELSPYHRISFTWQWEHTEMGQDSLVTIELHETTFEGQLATELILVHEKLKDPMARAEHNSGWVKSMIALMQFCEDRLVVEPVGVEQEL